MTDEPRAPPVKIYTITEAAERLRVSKRKLQDLLVDFPFYALNGNRKRFSDDDLAKLWDAMRQPVRKANPLFFASGAATPIPDAGDPYANLRKPKRPRRDPRVKRGA